MICKTEDFKIKIDQEEYLLCYMLSLMYNRHTMITEL